MHTDILATREVDARQRIKAAASTLARMFDVAPLESPTAVEKRQRAVYQMREAELIADLLERLVAATQEASHGSEENRSGSRRRNTA